ncbi:hypothetical protein N496_19935 (plasmid) [Clostridium botulinum A2B3 87]|uniref:hypothetical protein n=1 Tax=Clostridium botulinum TaxID=1491 RepID=UPI0004A5A2B1|nr:hypothetical protein [Clostridium botulinum]KEI94405.1 hypothetical protein N496_19935 [Clostridium botulinum A2B3 87]
MTNFIDDNKNWMEEEKANHKILMESQKYQQEIKYFYKLINDFIGVIYVCRMYSTRDWDSSENSLLLKHADEFFESAISCSILIEHGAINPVRRELRYMLETSIKYLIVDQGCPNLSYKDKIEYLDEHIPRSSIDCIKDIKIIGLDSLDIKDFIDNTNDVYKKLCKYVHPSKNQINEFIGRYKRGSYIGFESEVDIKQINNLVYKVFELVISFYITSLGFTFAKDIFIHYLDEKKNWKFHKSKYIKKISNAYDYKLERKK